MSVEDLRKVINEYPNYKQLSKHPTVQELTNFILIRDDHFEKVRKLIHIFQKDYGKYIHLLRKELRSVRRTVKDKPLQDFIDSLLKQSGM